jgi:hypothetical protein
MLRLKSTGVYFTAPVPAEGLAPLPGKLVQAVESPGAVMVGEFSGPNDEAWAMLVNLNLRDSAKLKLSFAGEAKKNVRGVSPVDGSLAPIESDNSNWLPAGHGVLLRVR